MPDNIVCTIWNNGADGWGIRVGSRNRRYFDKMHSSMIIELDGEIHKFSLSEKFWTTCPEFRGEAVKQWLQNHGIDRSNKNDYTINLTRINGKFRARLVERSGRSNGQLG